MNEARAALLVGMQLPRRFATCSSNAMAARCPTKPCALLHICTIGRLLKRKLFGGGTVVDGLKRLSDGDGSSFSRKHVALPYCLSGVPQLCCLFSLARASLWTRLSTFSPTASSRRSLATERGDGQPIAVPISWSLPTPRREFQHQEYLVFRMVHARWQFFDE